MVYVKPQLTYVLSPFSTTVAPPPAYAKCGLCDYDVVVTYGLAKAGSRVRTPLVAPDGLVGKWLIRLTVYQKIVGSSPIEVASSQYVAPKVSALPCREGRSERWRLTLRRQS